MADISALL